MLKTVEAILDEHGRVRLKEEGEIAFTHPQRVLITFLEPTASTEHLHETTLLSEAALGEDWNRPDEDEAWQHLQ